jgi:cytochrome c oxidase cbb3-type subunit 4
MDINDLRAVVTVVSLLTFLAVVAWAYGLKSNKKRFEEAANLPFADEEVDRAELGLPSGNEQGKES